MTNPQGSILTRLNGCEGPPCEIIKLGKVCWLVVGKSMYLLVISGSTSMSDSSAILCAAVYNTVLTKAHLGRFICEYQAQHGSPHNWGENQSYRCWSS